MDWYRCGNKENTETAEVRGAIFLLSYYRDPHLRECWCHWNEFLPRQPICLAGEFLTNRANSSASSCCVFVACLPSGQVRCSGSRTCLTSSRFFKIKRALLRVWILLAPRTTYINTHQVILMHSGYRWAEYDQHGLYLGPDSTNHLHPSVGMFSCLKLSMCLWTLLN